MASQTPLTPSYPHPTYNVTIDDSSPMIKYQPASSWSDNVYGDPNLFEYYEHSYHYTTAIGASASLTFTGTGVTVMGSTSLTHDAIEIRIDGRTIQGLQAYSTTKQYQVFLGAATGMDYGEHTIEVINASKSSVSKVLDIDAFVVESIVPWAPPAANKTLSLETMDDSVAVNGSNIITWSDGWATKSKGRDVSEFMNKTVHETTTKGSSVTFDFVGEAVQVIGGVGPNNTQYTIQVDDNPSVVMIANASDFVTSSTLYYQTNLTSGSHHLVVTNSGSNGGALTIDAFQIFNSGASPDSDFGVYGHKANVPLVVGVAVAIVVLLLILLGFTFFWRHRKRSRQMGSDEDRLSIAAPSYIERVKGSLPLALTRSSSRASGRTAVDPECGNMTRTEEEKQPGYGASWWKNVKEMIVKNPDPTTPPLPFQTQSVTGGVGDVAGGERPGIRRAATKYNGDFEREPEAAKVWMNGTRKIEQNRRLSDQSLDQAWDHRNSTHPSAYGQGSRQGHSRTQSSPTERSRTASSERDNRYSTFTVSQYGGGNDSPRRDNYLETLDHSRYEVEQPGHPRPAKPMTVAERRQQLLGLL